MRPTQLLFHRATSAPAPATQPKRSNGVRDVVLNEVGSAPMKPVWICVSVRSTLSQPSPAVPYSSTLSAGNQPRRARAVPRYLMSSAREKAQIIGGINGRVIDAAVDPLISAPLKSSSTPATTRPNCQL